MALELIEVAALNGQIQWHTGLVRFGAAAERDDQGRQGEDEECSHTS
jgi:hypothetical protein